MSKNYHLESLLDFTNLKKVFFLYQFLILSKNSKKHKCFVHDKWVLLDTLFVKNKQLENILLKIQNF